MTGAEAGFLLLSSHLGDPERRPLTMPQLRVLSQRVRDAGHSDPDRDLEPEDLIAMGYGREVAERIVLLLEDEALLNAYLRRAHKLGCTAVSRLSSRYPGKLRTALGTEAPGCLWALGDLNILNMPRMALVGSRELRPENRRFAEEAGRQAALQGYALVSGNARGADRTAQEACLQAGGCVISVVADELCSHSPRNGVLYLSEDGFEEAFSAQRALSRNRVIHGLGEKTLVAQCSLKTGGTWDGTVKNLRFGWSGVYAFRDGSPAMELLEQMGACLVNREELLSLRDLPAPAQLSLPMTDPGKSENG